MKKTYTKPQIAFEDFAVSYNVAATTCEITNPNDHRLLYLPFGHVFSQSCEFPLITSGDGAYQYGPGEFDTICYNVPDGFNLHNS